MILIVHNIKKVVSVKTELGDAIDFNANDSISVVLKSISEKFNNELIIWCNEKVEANLNINELSSIFHHKKILTSFNPSEDEYLSRLIGYVEHTPFIKINKNVNYPTWIMSSCVGGVNSDIINGISTKIKYDSDFDYFLNSLAKLVMPLGIMCYSNPNLIKNLNIAIVNKCSLANIFKFIKQHYKFRWVILLLLDLFLYEKRIVLLPFLRGVLFSRRKLKSDFIENIEVRSSKKDSVKTKIDVIIPTIGRKKYLLDVLIDLKDQDLLPNKIIIIEQNPDTKSGSELDYIYDREWPFKIDHEFIHKTGACNARNVAIKKLEGDWVFFADDDIRIKRNFLSSCIQNIKQYKQRAITLACLRVNDKETVVTPKQWGSFGSGCSLVDASLVKNMSFNERFEFGFGEDAEFGMQLRNKGEDVIYFPKPSLLHLKAPIGGFREKPVLQWANEPIKPKPSPTILLMKLLHHTKEQLKGYKTIMVIDQYKYQKTKNILSYLENIKISWRVSLHWAKKLKEN